MADEYDRRLVVVLQVLLALDCRLVISICTHATQPFELVKQLVGYILKPLVHRSLAEPLGLELKYTDARIWYLASQHIAVA
jgi:hypothetical protein